MTMMTTTTAIQTMSKECQMNYRDNTIRKLLTIYLSIIAKERDINMKRSMVHALFNYMLSNDVKSCIRNDAFASCRSLRIIIMGKIDELEHCSLCLEHADLMATFQRLKSFLKDCSYDDYKLVFGGGNGKRSCPADAGAGAADAMVFLRSCSCSDNDNDKDLLKKIKKYLTRIERLNDSILVDVVDVVNVEREEQPPLLRRSKRLRSMIC